MIAVVVERVETGHAQQAGSPPRWASATKRAVRSGCSRTREPYRVATTAQDTRTAYDELGRISSVKDTRYAMTYAYDAAGNRRHTVSNYYDGSNAAKTADYWYLYDGMNRILISQGMLASGTIGIGTSQGISLTYDAAGNRRAATSYQSGSQVTDSYTYDLDNHLKTTSRAGQQTSARDYDKDGRLTQYTNYSSPGVMSDRRVTAYNANGWTTSQLNYNAANTLIARVRYDYADSYDSYGNVFHYTVEGLTGTTYTYNYTKSYQKFESRREQTVSGSMSVNYPTGTTTSYGSTNSSYDANGNLIQVVDTLGTNTTRSFVVNSQGQILKKTEGGTNEYYYYANGNPIGSSGGTAADFDYNYTPVSDAYPASSPTSYVVNAGDTLQSIALAVFGDAKLWYLIADANGLPADLSGYVGKTITIPNRITNIHNDYATYKPYNGGAIVGDTTPTVPVPEPPPPPQQSGGGGGCGGAQIIVAIIAIVATIFTAGAALSVIAPELAASAAAAAGTTIGTFSGLMAAGGAALGGASIGAAMIGGAIGSIAGQVTGMALGVQDKFSWGAVAAGAIGAGVTAGGIGQIASTSSPIANQMINAAARSVVGQGINIMTGQQQDFNWAAIAVSAVSAPIASAISGALGATGLAAAGIGALTSEATRSAFTHSKFSWASVGANTADAYLRDAFGNMRGNAVVDQSLPRNEFGRTTLEQMDYEDALRDKANANLLAWTPPSTAPASSFGPVGGGTYGLDANPWLTDVMMGDPRRRVVPEGATLSGMAGGSYDRVYTAKLAYANGLSNPNAVRAGSEIMLYSPKELADLSLPQGYLDNFDASSARIAERTRALQNLAAQPFGVCLPGSSGSIGTSSASALGEPSWSYTGFRVMVNDYLQSGLDHPYAAGYGEHYASVSAWDPAVSRAAEARAQAFVAGYDSIRGANLGLGAAAYLIGHTTGNEDFALRAAIVTGAAGDVVASAFVPNEVLPGRQTGLTVTTSQVGSARRIVSAEQFISDVHNALEQKLNAGELAEFKALDPTAIVGLTGSSATGRVGNPNKATYGQPIDTTKFDLDLFVQSDVLLDRFGPSLRAAPDLRRSLVDEYPDLFSGLKPGKDGLSIKFRAHGLPPAGSVTF